MRDPSNSNLTLISHHLCPYVQRAVISLSEKDVPFDRIYVDLATKPAWFLEISPLGKTPVLKVGDTPIFESAVILEYLASCLDRIRVVGAQRHRGAISGVRRGGVCGQDQSA